MNHKLFFLTLLSLIVSLATHAATVEALDTVMQLKGVTVTASRSATADIIPSQSLQGEDLKRLNSQSVADALRYFSGVQVKDYGGVGGIKTVNVRSMGTNHTGVVYDGMELGNAQNGQIDLGQFSLDNIEAISLYNGQKSNILQPARDFSNAASIYMTTRRPQFAGGKRRRFRAVVSFGSFDLFNTSLLAETRVSKSITAQLSTEWLTSSGKYKFRYHRVSQNGQIAYDTTAVRQNGDINALRLEGNLYGTLAVGSWQAKVYHYNSHRGVPGAIVNNVWRRGERIGDNNTFVQGRLTTGRGRWVSLNNVKYAFYHTHYVNNDDRQVKINNTYKQQELYLSTSNMLELASCWQVSLSYDMMWNSMSSDMYNFVKPDRFSNFIALATSLNFNMFKMQASVTGTFIRDKFKNGRAATSRRAFTPAVFASWQPLRSYKDFTLRAFYKQSYRMPTFNDLYYADMGNSSLDPERVSQYNVGMALQHSASNSLLSEAAITLDAYYNYIKDKIVAYPRGQQFRWTMLNLGRVDIRGIDLSARATVNPADNLFITLRAQYTYQRAIDVTSMNDSYYRHQIPYIPHNSGSAIVNAVWKRWSLNCSWIWVGERYNQQENIRYNYMPSWQTTDLSLSRDFTLGRVKTRVLAEVNNVMNRDYDVILNYPMPKRNYRISLSVEF